MRLVNLKKENNDRYKVVLSREDWKKLLLEIYDYMLVMIFIVIFFTSILLFFIVFFVSMIADIPSGLSYNVLFDKYYYVFNSFKWSHFYVLMFLFVGFIFMLYFKSFNMVFKPFNLRGAMIDVVGKTIFLKNKKFSFKDTDRIVFYLEKNKKKDEIPLKNSNKNREKEKPASNWVYYVKKKASSEPNNKELNGKGFLANNLEEFIIPPAEIKQLVDFSLILGKEGLLGVWRQIAKLLGIDFEEKIEWRKEILLQATKNASYKTSDNFSIDYESLLSLDVKEKGDNKLWTFLNLLREKVDGKDASVDTSLDSTDFGVYLLFKEKLMGVRMFSAGFELRFWKTRSDFPSKQPFLKKKLVFDRLNRYIVPVLVLIIFYIGIFLVYRIEDEVLKIALYLGSLLLFVYLVTSELGDIIKDALSKEFLFRIMYLLEKTSIFMFGIIFIILGLSENALYFIISFPAVLFFLTWVLLFFSVLRVPNSFSCPWNLTINRYMSKLVFSFEDKILEGEYGFCVSRTHWQAPVSEVRSLGLLKTGRSLFGSGYFILAIKIDEDYVLLPLPDLGEDKILEILFFLQHVFNTLLASYSLNNTGTTK